MQSSHLRAPCGRLAHGGIFVAVRLGYLLPFQVQRMHRLSPTRDLPVVYHAARGSVKHVIWTILDPPLCEKAGRGMSTDREWSKGRKPHCSSVTFTPYHCVRATRIWRRAACGRYEVPNDAVA